MISAPVNKIISFSNVDGPGNRTAIFLQSCPFHCWYCHNPETIHYCCHCGKCIETCPVGALSMVNQKVVWDDKKCVQCDTCIKTCPHLATPKIHHMTVEDVMVHIRKARPFIKGITVSGGECTNHPEFLTELFQQVHTLGLTCFLDSNGCYDFEKMDALMQQTDMVMLDVKAFDSHFHQELTGSDNAIVLKNLDYLLKQQKLYEVRTVLLQDEDQNTKTVSSVAEIIKDQCFYKLIKYRPFGVRQEGLKYCGQQIVSDQQLEKMQQLAIAHGATKIKLI